MQTYLMQLMIWGKLARTPRISCKMQSRLLGLEIWRHRKAMVLKGRRLPWRVVGFSKRWQHIWKTSFHLLHHRCLSNVKYCLRQQIKKMIMKFWIIFHLAKARLTMKILTTLSKSKQLALCIKWMANRTFLWPFKHFQSISALGLEHFRATTFYVLLPWKARWTRLDKTLALAFFMTVMKRLMPCFSRTSLLWVLFSSWDCWSECAFPAFKSSSGKCKWVFSGTFYRDWNTLYMNDEVETDSVKRCREESMVVCDHSP